MFFNNVSGFHNVACFQMTFWNCKILRNGTLFVSSSSYYVIPHVESSWFQMSVSPNACCNKKYKTTDTWLAS